MKKINAKRLLIIPLIALIGLFVCTISVKNGVINVITSTINKLFEGNEEQLILKAAQNSGFEDINLYEAVINAYNNELTNRGSISYLGGFNGEVEYGLDSVTINNGSVNYYGSDTSVGRYNPGNRVGVNITAPQNLDYETIKNAKIIRSNHYKDGSVKSYNQVFYQVEDSKEEDLIKYYQSWPVVTEDLSKVTIYIEWTEDNHQTFSINFGDEITLEEPIEESKELEEDKKGTISTFEDFYTTDNYDIENDTIIFNNINIPYYEENLEIGRTAGNRVGIKILLPNIYSTDLKNNVIITRYYTDNTSTSTQYNLSEIIDDSSFIGVWALVTEDLIDTTIMKIGITWNENDPQQVFTIKLGNNVTLENKEEVIEEPEIAPVNLTEEIESTEKCQFKFGTLTTKDCLTESQLAIIKELNASNLNISNLTGIEKLSNLIRLDLSNNNLANVDLTSNTKLEQINLTNNPFEKEITYYQNSEIDPKELQFAIKLPDNIVTEYLTSNLEEDKYIVTYGKIEEQTPIYNVSYKITYIEYSDLELNYLVRDNTIYTINSEFILKNNQINNITLNYDENKLHIYNEDNKLIKTYEIERIDITTNAIKVTDDYIYYRSNIDDVITTTENELITTNIVDGNIIVKLDENIIYSRKLLTMTSDTYDIKEDYIFTGIEKISTESINHPEEITINIGSENKLVITYNEETLEELYIKTITSEKYDLTKNYIIDNEFNIEDIICDENIITKEYNTEENIVKLRYNDKTYQYYIVSEMNNPYIIKENTIYTKFNEILNPSSVNLSNTISTKTEDNKLIIKLNINDEEQVKIYQYDIVEPTYTIAYNHTDKYIYTGNDKEYTGLKTDINSEIIISNDNSKVTFKSPIEEITFDLITIDTEYDLDNEYIYTGSDEFKIDDVHITSGQKEIQNNRLIITYQEDILKTIPIVTVKSSNYIISNKTISTGYNKFNIDNVEVTNGKIDESGNIYYNNSIIDNYEIKETTFGNDSGDYDLTKGYIYLGTNELDESKIKINNGTYVIKNNEIIIKDNINNELTPISLVKISSKVYNTLPDKYIYTGTNSFNIGDIEVINGSKTIENNKLVIRYYNSDEPLEIIPIITLSSNGYLISGNNISIGFNDLDINKIKTTNGVIIPSSDKKTITLSYSLNNIVIFTKSFNILKTTYNNLSKNYIYTKTNDLNIDDIIVTNGDKSLSKDKKTLTITSNLKETKTYKIIKISSTTYQDYLNKDYIYTGLNKFKESDITINNNGSVVIEDYKVYIKYENDTLDSYDLVTIINNSKYDISGSYVYTKFVNSITNQIEVTNGSKSLESNKLVIKRNNDILKTIDIVHIDFGKLNIKDNNIIIKPEDLSKVSYQEFISNISCTLSTCKLLNGSKTITNGIIENGMILKVLYNNKEIDEFNIVVDYVEIKDIITDENNNFISGIKLGSSANEIVGSIQTSGTVTISNQKGEIINNNTKLGTGYIININLNDNKKISYTVVVKGDISGDGIINSGDLLKTRQHLLGIDTLTGAFNKASDINNDNVINSGDLLLMRQHLLGIKTIE